MPGSSVRMLATARALFHDGLSPASRAARCYFLAEDGRLDLPLRPRNPEPVAIVPDQPVEKAASDVLSECLDQIATNIVVVRKLDDAEGPHQLRNGFRRLRIAVGVYMPVLECAEADRLSSEARWLYRCVGKLRDLDVVEQLTRSSMGLGLAISDSRSLADECAERAAQARLDLRNILAGGRTHSFLLDLAGFVETLGWSRRVSGTDRQVIALPVLSFLAITQAWSSLPSPSQAPECLGLPERHELRKRLRRLRHVVESFRPLYAARHVDPLLSLLRQLQNDLGDVTDAALAETVLTGSGPTKRNQSVQSAVDRLLGILEERSEASWRAFRSRWIELANARLLWRQMALEQGRVRSC